MHATQAEVVGMGAGLGYVEQDFRKWNGREVNCLEATIENILAWYYTL